SMPAGIELAGVLNGDIEIRSAFKNPYIQSDIEAKGIEFNKTPVGDMILKADLDQSTQLVNLAAELKNQGKQSLFVNGTYDALNKENSLDLAMRLNDSELIIFQPFLR